MNVNLLIDNIVRQTTVLIAQLATASGGRAPLAHVAGQVFLDLVHELKAQGLGHKVIADMFGLALRTYHDRVRRVSESATDRGVSLWEAVLDFVRSQQVVTRAALLRRFNRDDEATVRGVLKDLVESGLVFKSGREERTTYRAASLDELEVSTDPAHATSNMIWVVLHQQGATTAQELSRQLTLNLAEVRTALSTLVERGHLHYEESSGHYRADDCVIPYEAEHGWEAALFDHYQAVVTAMANKVSRGQARAHRRDAIGGSTFHFDLYRGHPKEKDVLALLGSVREVASRLRSEVDASPAREGAESYRVVFYAGQNVIEADAPLPEEPGAPDDSSGESS